GAGGSVAARDRDRVAVGADDALRGRRLLHFGYDGRRARPQGGRKAAPGCRVAALRLEGRNRCCAPGLRHVGAARRDDLVQNHRGVNPLSASSLPAAAPLSIAARASARPCLKSSALPPTHSAAAALSSATCICAVVPRPPSTARTMRAFSAASPPPSS